MRGKRVAEDEGFDFSSIPFKQIAVGILIIAVLFGVGFGGFFLVKNIIDKPEEQSEDVEEESGMIETLEGYSVLGKVKIENLGIDTYILDSTEENALKVASGKLIGNELNEEGNFCIVGHNYENIFLKLLEIEKDEEIIIVDLNENETKYEVIDVKTIEPDELDVLLDVDGKTQITLITCENTASTRLVVVAEKIEESTTNDEVENIVE